MPEMSVKPICLTPGDITGIGPEVSVKFLVQAHQQKQFKNQPILVIGNISHLKQTAKQLNVMLPDSKQITYQAIETTAASNLPGQFAYEAIAAAVQLISHNQASALVTGPISKENLKQAGIDFSGHTEILEALAKEYFPNQKQLHQAEMLFVYQKFRMLLLTRHIPLSEVSGQLSVSGVSQSLDSLVAFLKTQAGIQTPNIGMLGVNPHAGETGIGGDEETMILQPAMAAIAQTHQLRFDPPLAADAAFRNFDPTHPRYDAYVAAYHDQGLIPVKLLGGLNAVNVTIGLPFIRTSVSHGTAPDIVGLGIADASAMHAAFDCAVAFLKN